MTESQPPTDKNSWASEMDKPQHTVIDFDALPTITPQQAQEILASYVATLRMDYKSAVTAMLSTTPELVPLMDALQHRATGISAGGSTREMDESDRTPLREARRALLNAMDSDQEAQALALPLYNVIRFTLPYQAKNTNTGKGL